MSVRTTKPICLALIGVLLVGSIGCHSCCRDFCSDPVCGPHKCCPEERPSVLPQVTTGGLYASLRSLPIPESGLTLAGAVEQTLRPGVRSELASGRRVTEAIPSSTGDRLTASINARELIDGVIEIYKQTPTPYHGVALKAWAQDLQFGSLGVGGEAWFQGAIADLFSLEATRIALMKRDNKDAVSEIGLIVDQIAAYADSNAPEIQPAEDTVAAIKNVRGIAPTDVPQNESLRSLSTNTLQLAGITALLKNRAGDLSPAGTTGDLTDNETRLAKTVQEILDGSKPILPTGDSSTAANLATNNIPPNRMNPTWTANPNTNLGELVVVLKRNGAKSIVTPLKMVLASPVGDIQLQEYDRVEVTSYAQTALKNRKARSGNYTVAGFASTDVAKTPAKTLAQLSNQVLSTQSEGYSANVIAIDLAGTDEQYWVPVAGGAFGGLGGPRMASSVLSAGDRVNLTAVQLLPQVQASRIRRRMDNVQNEIQKCLHEELNESVQKAPLSQTIFNTARQTMRRVGIPTN